MCECRPRSSRTSSARIRVDRLGRRPAGQREAELLVLVRGGDVLVGVRLDADGDPDHHLGRRCVSRAIAVSRSISSNESTTIRPTPASTARRSSGVGLVVAVQADPLRRHAGAQRHGQLAAGADVEAQPLLGDDADDRLAEERLARVEDVRAGERVAGSRRHRARKSASSRTYAGVPYSSASARTSTPPTVQRTVVLARDRLRPELRHERVDVVRACAARTGPLEPRSACRAPAS